MLPDRTKIQITRTSFIHYLKTEKSPALATSNQFINTSRENSLYALREILMIRREIPLLFYGNSKAISVFITANMQYTNNSTWPYFAGILFETKQAM